MVVEKIIKVVGMVNEPKWHRLMKVVLDDEGICTTLNTCGGGNLEPKIQTNGVYRKITPLESWRFMGFSDEDFDKAKAVGVSDSQCYKQAGNSIVVNVLEAIFGQMLRENDK
jgi:site-specific DNA-cytosine methylase